jgi:hypothetical protein
MILEQYISMKYNYAIIEFVREDLGLRFPTGFIVWSEEKQSCNMMFMPTCFMPEDIKKFVPIMEFAAQKIMRWRESGKLPDTDTDKNMKCYETRFWVHVSKILIHQVRLTIPHLQLESGL